MTWYTVYAIELSNDAHLGPKSDTTKPYIYVGITSQTPEGRFATHKAGGPTASDIVRRHGLRLRPDLTSGCKKANGRTRAVALEQEVAADLRAKGYIVDAGQPGMGWDRFRR